MNTEGLVCDFGKHEGELYTRIPINYLLWMVNIGHSRTEIAEAELARRGTTLPRIEVSGHAINRCSLRLLRTWERLRKDEEGIHAWLCRVGEEALEHGKRDDQGRVLYMGMKFVFKQEAVWPVMLTVMRQNR